MSFYVPVSSKKKFNLGYFLFSLKTSLSPFQIQVNVPYLVNKQHQWTYSFKEWKVWKMIDVLIELTNVWWRSFHDSIVTLPCIKKTRQLHQDGRSVSIRIFQYQAAQWELRSYTRVCKLEILIILKVATKSSTNSIIPNCCLFLRIYFALWFLHFGTGLFWNQ